MRSNLGFADRSIRFIIALILGFLVFSESMQGLPGLCLFIFGFALVVTCFKGSCPVYRFLGISTHKNLNDRARDFEYRRTQTMLKNYLRNYEDSYPPMDKEIKKIA
jgi:hypothetical protein